MTKGRFAFLGRVGRTLLAPFRLIARIPGPAMAAVVVAAAIGSTVAWLFMGASETVERRTLATPKIALSLDGKGRPKIEGGPEVLAAMMAKAPSEGMAKSADAAPKPAAGAAEEAKASPPAISLPSMTAPAKPAAEAAKLPPQLASLPKRKDIGPPVQLRKAPEPGMFEQSEKGPLPIVAEDGRTAWRTYARPAAANDGRPKVAVVIAELGLSNAATEVAIQGLPGVVTLAFAPQAMRLNEQIEQARAAGHEVLIGLPLEPAGFPRNDAGPNTLLASLSTAENLDRLEWVLSRVHGYVGVLNTATGRMTTSEESLQPILSVLRRRGLLFVDGGVSSRSIVPQVAATVGLPRAFGNRIIDVEASRAAIDQRLADLERTAQATGFAVGVGSAFPVTIERVAVWADGLADRGVALVPITAIAERNAAP